jgi:hypothetical protein
MIAHVASSGEDSGRVVLQFGSRRPSAVALRAAIRIAQAFQSEIESLFVENQQLLDCTSFSFVREISLTGRWLRTVSKEQMALGLHLAASDARRQVEKLARQAAIPLRSRVVRDEPLRAISVACAETGPWNVVVLAEPLSPGDAGFLKQLMLEIDGATGLGLVGPKAQRCSGPAIVVVEDTDLLPGMLMTAERMAALDNANIVLLLTATREGELAQMEGQARLVVGGREDVRIEPAEIDRGEAAVLAETLRRLRGGFVIGQYGGVLVPEDGDLRPLLAALECPLFLVR